MQETSFSQSNPRSSWVVGKVGVVPVIQRLSLACGVEHWHLVVEGNQELMTFLERFNKPRR